MQKEQLILEVYRGNSIMVTENQDTVPDGMLRVEGTLAVVNTMNRNGRFYEAGMYQKHIGEMQQRISESNGIFGEMEHPTSMNINLHNVSHKIEDISFNESTGEVKGKILLMDTPSGKIAQSVVRSGSPLPISSRAIGKINEDKSVDVKRMATFDLVGTAGFKQASLMISESVDTAEGSKMLVECYAYDLNEDGNVVTEKATEVSDEVVQEKVKEVLEGMNLVTKEQALEIAKTYVLEEAAPQIRKFVSETEGSETVNENDNVEQIKAVLNEQFLNVYAPIIEKWSMNEFAPTIEKWVETEFAPVVEHWVSNEFAPVIQKWVTEDYSGTLQAWLANEFSPAVQNWVHEDYSKALQAWMTSEFKPSILSAISEAKEDDEKSSEVAKEKEKIEDDKENVKDDIKDADAEKDVDDGASIKNSDDKKDDKKSEKDDDKKVDETVDKNAIVNESKDDNAKVDESNKELLARLDTMLNEAKTKGKTVATQVLSQNDQVAVALNEQFAKAPEKWLRLIPEAFKPIWLGMNESQQLLIRRQASTRTLSNVSTVQKFWETRPMDSIISEHSQSSKRVATMITESADSSVNEGHKQLSVLAQSIKPF